MMSRFPGTATKYMNKNSPKTNMSSSEFSERPRRRNRDTDVWFSPSISLDFFLITQEKIVKIIHLGFWSLSLHNIALGWM
jgi:hypothetical protein